jgi:hypothetical protein
VTAMCYLAYSYNTLSEVLASDGMIDGWDPVRHLDLDSANVLVKSAAIPGQYPLIALSDFGDCRREKEHEDMNTPDEKDERTHWGLCRGVSCILFVC